MKNMLEANEKKKKFQQRKSLSKETKDTKGN